MQLRRPLSESKYMHLGEPFSEHSLPEAPGRVVVVADDISRRVRELSEAIAADYSDRELTILAVLTGSLIFLADLIRKMPVMMRVDLVSVSSYPGRTTTSRGPRVTTPWTADMDGRDVLIVDDILDSGGTLKMLREAVLKAGAADVRTCVLLSKSRDDLSERVEPEYVGFDVPDEFLIGYGLDYDGFYRNLPDVRALAQKPEASP